MKSILQFWGRAALPLCLLFLASAATAQQQSSQPTLKVLYTFKAQGGTPTAIVEVSPGVFLGITATTAGLFSITKEGAYKFFYTFPPNPQGVGAIGLTPALNGQVYGAAANSGTVTTFSELFSVGVGGQITTHAYNGETQGGPEYLVQAPDGGLYTFFALSENPVPVFTRVDYQGNPTSLYTFSASQGLPYRMILGENGNFYGLTLTNGTKGLGIFRLTPSGSFSWLVPSAGVYGGYGMPSLIEAVNGNFYGTVPQGGSAEAGSIYQVTPAGAMKTLYEFSEKQLGLPETLLQASDGMIYGTTRGEYTTGFHGYSRIFRLDPSSGALQTVYSFKNLALGECECRMVQGSDGKLYGVSENIGTYGGGTIWVLDAGLPPPLPHVGGLFPPSGNAGQKVLLWGKNLLGATAVSFNGTAASHFSVPSSQGVWAWVPDGASTGPVTVTTPNGSFTTTDNFTVQ
jgi:uncharacterized repeat protein (TIGR03803 family)